MKSYRPNVTYKQQRQEEGAARNLLDHQLGWYKYLSKEDLDLFSPKELTGIRRNHYKIKQCGLCKNFYLVGSKKLYKFGGYFRTKLGIEYRCDMCHFNRVTESDHLQARSKSLKKIFEHVKENISSSEPTLKTYFVDPKTL